MTTRHFTTSKTSYKISSNHGRLESFSTARPEVWSWEETPEVLAAVARLHQSSR